MHINIVSILYILHYRIPYVMYTYVCPDNAAVSPPNVHYMLYVCPDNAAVSHPNVYCMYLPLTVLCYMSVQTMLLYL